MRKVLFLLTLSLFVCAASVSAQPRPPEKNQTTTSSAPKRNAPASFVARYEGGMFGYNEKAQGTLKFDDDNERLVFFSENQKEMFAIPYAAMLVIYPNSKKVQSGTGRAIGAIPFPGAGLGGGFLKKKKNYLIIQFSDPDVDVQGTSNFLIDTTELLESVVQTLGEKAKLVKRGDAFYRPKMVKTEI